jgi:predicted SprT family Zn-dependent metalloprotease
MKTVLYASVDDVDFDVISLADRLAIIRMKRIQRLWEQRSADYGLAENGWRLKWSFNTTSFLGDCNYGKKTIRMSWVFMKDRRNSVKELEDTLLHEIAHAIAGSDAHHGPIWRDIAEIIGCSGITCSSMLQKTKKPKYTLVCKCREREYFNKCKRILDVARGKIFKCTKCDDVMVLKK